MKKILGFLNRQKIVRKEVAMYAVTILNEALENNPDAINELMALEVHTKSKYLAEHPPIQVSGVDWNGEKFVLRPMGLINGLLGASNDSWGHIIEILDDDKRIVQFGIMDPKEYQRIQNKATIVRTK